MSEFVDKLKSVSQAVSQPMGFRRGQSASSKLGMLLVASLAQVRVSNLADLVSGADAGLLDIDELGQGNTVLRYCTEAVPNMPWGGWLKGGKWQRNQRVNDLGGDFVVLPAANTPLRVLENSGVGKIVEVDATLSEDMLGTIDELPVDGVFLAVDYKDSPYLTLKQLMLFQHLSDLLAKPLLVPVTLKVTAGELRVLWEAGVSGVIVEIGAGQRHRGLKKLREAIDKFSFPPQRRRGRVKARLPLISSSADIKSEPEVPDDSY